MAYHLVITFPFENYQKGAVVRDKREVEALLASHHDARFVKVLAPDEPTAPEPPPVDTPH